MKRIAIALLAGLMLAGTACTKARTGPGATPTRSGGQTRSPAGLPTGGPTVVTGNLSKGQASVQVAGDLEAEFTVKLASPVIYAPPPGSLAIRWGEGSNAVGLVGLTFSGTRPTSTTFSLVLSFDTGSGTAFFATSGDECRITIDAATAHRMAGSFTCSGLKSSGGQATVDASGRFSASG